MPFTLNQPPGYCDLPDAVLNAEEIAYAIHVGRISVNAEFGMVRPEIFSGLYTNGQQVILPTSRVDGYNYARDELLYFWAIGSSAEPQTGWITGPDSLWFTNWDVQQYDRAQSADSEFNKKAGTVFCQEWYRRSGTHSEAQASSDGILQVFTIAQRLRNQLMVAASPTWANIDESLIATADKPWKDPVTKQLNGNAKWAVLNTEVFYLGEYVNGQVVTLPVSQAGPLGNPYAYTAAECKFMAAWRWTAQGNLYQQPSEFQGQLGPFKCAISASGLVTLSVDFIDDLGFRETHSEFGRVAVFAFCTRANGPTALPLANQFEEIDNQFFTPGETLRASTVLAIKKNIDESVLTPEFFGPTIYKNGDIIPLPVSPVDGYPYSRAELMYAWYWSDTTNQTGQNLRIPIFDGRIIDANSSNASAYAPGVPGQVVLHVWRLPPGSDPVDDNNSLARLTVLTVGFRQAQLPELIDIPVNPPAFPPPTPGALLGAVPGSEVALAPSAPGDFTVAHGLGGTPALVLIEMTSGGNIWFRGARYDGTNLYLSASDAGVTGKALIFTVAPAAEIALAPSAPGDFAVGHGLGATPGLVLIQMTSGGNIWNQLAIADNSLLYLSASDAGVTGKAECWLALTGNADQSMNHLTVPLSATDAGNFQVPHGLGITPLAVLIHMNAPGFPAFWFQAARYDDVNIYLVSPGAGVSGFAEVLY